ncbi:MAG: YbaB/EbfC family nucleoid-associated protein [Candidatus Nomurabacteria bacterium]|nr:MAG: YbaB/EbfC family nucleoid-associated protein [Candidatus Nomurabacteria bacterium]
MLDQAKLALQAKKIQKELTKTVIEVNSQDEMVSIRMTGEQKLKSIQISEEKVDGDFRSLERNLEDTMREAIQKAQEVAQEKLKPIMGQLGGLGL